ncbi:MAG: hypothetical protein ACOCXM_01425 [Myxococcota bacterium]
MTGLVNMASAAPLLALLLGLLPVPSAAQSGELAVIVHPSNSVDSLSTAKLESIFTSSRRHWKGGRSIVAFNYEAHDSKRVAFDRAVLQMKPDEVSKFWINQRIRGRGEPPRSVPSAKLMLRVVQRLEGAIGYVPLDLARRGDVKIVAVVRNGEVEPR